MEKQEDRHPEGVPALLREFAGGRSGNAAATVLQGKKVAPGVKFYLGAASKWVQEEAEQRGIWQTLLDAGAQPLARRLRAVHRPWRRAAGARRSRNLRHQPQFQGTHGIARRQVLSRQPGGGSRFRRRRLHSRPARSRRPQPGAHLQGIASRRRRPEKVEILPGFPERVRGRLVFLPQDNVNTDAIYGKDYTYRDDVTPETMAKVVDGELRSTIRCANPPGDVVVSGFNFGTGSSREQAVTCLEGQGNSAGDRRQFLADLSAQRL